MSKMDQIDIRAKSTQRLQTDRETTLPHGASWSLSFTQFARKGIIAIVHNDSIMFYMYLLTKLPGRSVFGLQTRSLVLLILATTYRTSSSQERRPTPKIKDKIRSMAGFVLTLKQLVGDSDLVGLRSFCSKLVLVAVF